MKKSVEILAPAGNYEMALAAASAGADAVYFGLPNFNARRRATNISFDTLPELVSLLHSHGVKAYLTMNTDISQRELAESARYYAFAKIAGIDALIIKDLCFFTFAKYLGKIPLHISTQAAISTSSSAKFAKELGAERVILARELSAQEIKAVAAIEGIESEIFVQGAMCFSVSGRCLLSSWIGGRSGNRGLCASPCRMEWKDEKSDEKSRIMSMKDMSLLKHMDEISSFGIVSVKIEGRLKSAEWVRKAVKTVKAFRDGIEGAVSSEEELGSYAGREMTDAYYLAKRTALLSSSSSGRVKSLEFSDIEVLNTESSEQETEKSVEIFFEKNTGNKIRVRVCLTGERLEENVSPIVQEKGQIVEEIFLKARSPASKKNLFPQAIILDSLEKKFREYRIIAGDNNEEFFFSSSDLSKIESLFFSLFRKLAKQEKPLVKIALDERLLSKIRLKNDFREFRKRAVDSLDRVRISARQMRFFNKAVLGHLFIVECLSVNDVKSLILDFHRDAIIALPHIIYEDALPEICSMIKICADNGRHIELNNFDAIIHANEFNIEWEAGPGLMVLNSFAGELLAEKGAKSVTISLEADEVKIEELASASALPLSIYLFGRPKLMQSRNTIANNGLVISEKRGLELNVVIERDLSVFYPKIPYRIPVPAFANLIRTIDLVFSPDPLYEINNWQKVVAEQFNYSRKLR